MSAHPSASHTATSICVEPNREPTAAEWREKFRKIQERRAWYARARFSNSECASNSMLICFEFTFNHLARIGSLTADSNPEAVFDKMANEYASQVIEKNNFVCLNGLFAMRERILDNIATIIDEKKRARDQRLAKKKGDRGELKRNDLYWSYLSSRAWTEKRAVALDRDGHRCVVCGDVATQVHHLSYDRVGDEDPGDLQSLCRGCHSYEHKNKNPFTRDLVAIA